MYGNLFELRKDWPIPSSNNTATAKNPKPPIMIKPQEQDQLTPHCNSTKPRAIWMGTKLSHLQECRRRLGGDNQKQFQQTNTNTQTQDTQQKNSLQAQNMRQIQAHDPQHTLDCQVQQNPKHTWTQFFNVPDR